MFTFLCRRSLRIAAMMSFCLSSFFFLPSILLSQHDLLTSCHCDVSHECAARSSPRGRVRDRPFYMNIRIATYDIRYSLRTFSTTYTPVSVHKKKIRIGHVPGRNFGTRAISNVLKNESAAASASDYCFSMNE